ncbi:MAG: thiamine diphosphokinase [Oscillospiraceae bacterium]|nr:thiamine diphosphokinase [Oscillospiraceae bacterium]
MINDKKVCLIVGAGELDGAVLCRRESDFVIAADGGLKYLAEAGVTPDLVVGDFDSLGYKPNHPNIICHPPEKDDTDTMLAVKEGFARGFDTFLLYAGLGGRLDHTVANLQTLSYIAERGGRGYIVGGNSVSTVIRNGKIEFAAENSGMISVFCSGETAKGVTISGLKYEVEDAELGSDFPLGASNEFCGKAAAVSVKSGRLLIIWQQQGFYPLLQD